MKIVHLMLACFYIDKYSYQENYLPKYHKEQGHDVEIIASLFTFDENGNGKQIERACKYENEHGIPVTRLDYAKKSGSERFRYYVGLQNELERIKPDLIFIHGVQFCDISVVVKYCNKHKNVKVYADSHADFSNSAKNWISKNILHRIIWRSCAKKIEPFVTRFYGVLPARVDFLETEYKLPRSKIELLVMGADDEAVIAAENPETKKAIKEGLGINDGDFLVMYGGKTDNYKKQVFMLMDAVNQIDNPNLKLVIFGSVIPELKEEINKRCSDRVKYIGWLLAADSYKYFAVADLVCFPGRHSVFWEQVAGQGIPMLCKKWAGTTHVDLGGNVRFLTSDSVEEIKEEIENLLNNPDAYARMKQVAEKEGRKVFSYKDIAKRSIEV